MPDYLESLETQRNHAANRMRQIIARSEERGARIAREERRAVREGDYSLSAEENSELERANAAYDRYSDEVKNLTGYHARISSSDEYRADVYRAIRSDRDSGSSFSDAAGYLTRALMSGEQHVSFESVRGIDVGYEARALQSVGGSAIPTTFADFVVTYERTLNPMMDVSRVLSTRTGAPIVVPRVTADVVAGGTVTAEAAGITEADPTLGQATLGAFKVGHTTIYSAELDQDEVVNLDQLLADAIARPIGLGWGSFFTLGTGTTQPYGFLSRATNAGTALGTANGNSGDKYWSPTDLVTLFYALPAPYRLNGSWMTSSPGKMRSFKDSTGNFIWQPGNLALGQPDTFLGRPVYENPAMVAAGSANTAIAFGDFSRYIIRDVTPMRVDISKDYKFNVDSLALRVITRRDGDLVDAAAVRYLVSQAI